jgi:cardiolipin synthase
VSGSALALIISGGALLIDLIIRIAALIIIPRDRKPSVAMAWLLAIFLIPYVGVAIYFLVGSSKLPKARRRKQVQINETIAASVASMQLHTEPDAWPAWFRSIVTMNQDLGAFPALGGNAAHLIGDYEQSVAAMTAEIDTATTYVHVQFYIVSFDKTTKDFFRALEDAVKRGVTVRVLLDHIASVRTADHKRTFAELDRIGAEWSFMLPVQPLKGKYQRPDLRNHRKLVVVDGRAAFMGSQNLIDRSYNSKKNLKRGLKWQELMTRVTGPIVSEINAIFIGDWYCETDVVLQLEEAPIDTIAPVASSALECQLVPSGPGYETENNLRLFLALLYSAQEKVIITSPYFVPDDAMIVAITSAKQRGLDVQLFVSEIGDQGPVFHAQRSYYEVLLKAGVQIWRYPAPFILHAKHLSIDEDVAVIGSSNMDIRSFSLDLEISLMVRSPEFVAEMRAVEAEYRAISKELTLDEWKREPAKSTFLDGLARLTSSLQ